MVQETFRVVDEAGLHARPASLISAAAQTHSGPVNIIYKEKSYTLKSIMIVMSLGIPCGADFTIEVDGDNAETKLSEIKDVLTTHHII